MRKFVLVTATKTKPGSPDIVAAGIKKLKRGTSMNEFIDAYFSEQTSSDIDLKNLLQRNSTFTLIKNAPEETKTWSFTEYAEDDLLHAVKHLTKEELLRDLRELLPLKEFKQ